MPTYSVDLGQRSYPIHIGPGLLNDAGLLRSAIPGKSAVIISNETVAPIYLSSIQPALEGLRTDAIILPDGEAYKSMATMESIYTRLLEGRFDRNTTLLALGGGVIGDIAGFAAASYQRGIHFIQVPTTLLAQVDSSVGGKTGVNHPLGKNMIGAFYQPRMVLIDTNTLNTLPDRELSAGLAEIIKYGLISDADFFSWLESNITKLRQRHPETLTFAIERSCRNKAAVVAQDEHERGQRALLNLGHTFGHAIETGLGYGRWSHGEAVGCGMVMAAHLSWYIGWLSTSNFVRIKRLIDAAGLPLSPPSELTPDRMLELMAVDKKVIDGIPRLVLLRDIGDAVIAANLDQQALIEILTHPVAG